MTNWDAVATCTFLNPVGVNGVDLRIGGMHTVADWRGTWLSAVFLAHKAFWNGLPVLLDKWTRSGWFLMGTAEWLDLHPDLVSYERVMSGQRALTTTWEGDVSSLIKQSQLSTLVRLHSPFHWEHGLGEVSIDVSVNQDNSVRVYLNAPLEEVYVGQSTDTGMQNIERFVGLACDIFDPSQFVVGYIDEEASLPDLRSILNGSEPLPHDWCFIGSGLASGLRPMVEPSVPPQGEVRLMDDGGLFVRWTTWDEPSSSPVQWRNNLTTALHVYRSRLFEG